MIKMGKHLIQMRGYGSHSMASKLFSRIIMMKTCWMIIWGLVKCKNDM